jgi:hypothetical protein
MDYQAGVRPSSRKLPHPTLRDLVGAGFLAHESGRPQKSLAVPVLASMLRATEWLCANELAS